MNIEVCDINNVYKLIKDKKYELAEQEIDRLFQKSDNAEIGSKGRIYDFENDFQMILYCNISKNKSRLEWKRSFISDLYYQKGFIFLEKQQYENAMENLKESLKWNPVKFQSYMEILEIYTRMKDWNKFEEYFTKAIKVAIKPEEISKLYRKYAYLCIETNEYEKAYNVLRYSSLIYYREENINEIKYLSSIEKINLKLSPDIGCINYIRESGLEYNVQPEIINTYISIANLLEEQLVKNELNHESKINILYRLVDIYTNLYIFNGDNKTHNLQMEAIKKYSEELKMSE